MISWTVFLQARAYANCGKWQEAELLSDSMERAGEDGMWTGWRVFYGSAKLLGLRWDGACFNKGVLRWSTRFFVAMPARYLRSSTRLEFEWPQNKQMLPICSCRIAHQRLLPLCTAAGLCYRSSDAVEQGWSDVSSCNSSWTRSSEPTPGNCPLSCHRAQPRQDNLGT